VKKQPAPTPEVMTTPEAALYLRCSTQLLEIMRCRGGGPPYTKVGRLVRYRKSALEKWLAEREQINTAGVALAD
jgi:excisionase family DNA binding protein